MRKKRLVTDIHHRRPTSIGGSSYARNLSKVPVSKHRAWHTLFSNMEACDIADEINATWIDPDYELVWVRKPKGY